MKVCMKDMEWELMPMKKNTLKWFSPLKIKKSEEFVKKVYVSETEGPRRRGRPVVRWKDRVKEYMHERVAGRGRGIEQARRECVDRERWRLFYRGVRDYRSIDPTINCYPNNILKSINRYRKCIFLINLVKMVHSTCIVRL